MDHQIPRLNLGGFRLPIVIWVFCIVGVTMILNFAVVSEAKCDFKAIFNFGDSNSDTGGFWAAFPAQSGPFGMTYFKQPSGRASDGRLIIDFLAQALGLPFLSPYLQSIGSNFIHGANYATLASTVLLPETSLFVTGISPFALSIQLNQMKDFKERVSQQNPSDTLPPYDIFGQLLYTFYIGQNDFTSNLAAIGINGVKQYLPQVVAQIVDAVKEVYALGGRSILVFNLAPIGCYPTFLVQLPYSNSDLDMYGCMISYNNAVIEYNDMLRNALDRTRKSLTDAHVIYVDTHSVYLELFRHPTYYGLRYGIKSCCGFGGGDYNFDPKVYCGNSKVANGSTMTAIACSDPENYASWDGIHATEATNKLITWDILNGTYFDPPFPLDKYCDLHPIG
ncbi:GDSL esterase/lipase At4g01130-like [Papaver somniferum]|uniref:GDSL esterase/lipase At4g01130-like n=1 Tax=Papaver somniferum TaxID=3469 RepID=UPI000E702B5A|nr:GDSL esterase/lipase At4g01130-like [Papaver somniferum]